MPREVMEYVRACAAAANQTAHASALTERTQRGEAHGHAHDDVPASAHDNGHDAHGEPHSNALADPPARPGGAGRWLVAVLVDATLDVDPHVVLGLARRDVLVLSSPGPSVRPEELALLEHAVREERVALCLVLVREGEGARAAATAPTPAAEALRRRLTLPAQPRAPLAGAAASPAEWHGVQQAELLATSSEVLRAAVRAGLLRAAVAVLPAPVRTRARHASRDPTAASGLRFDAPWFARPSPDEFLREQVLAEPPAPAATPAPAAPRKTPARTH